MNNGCK